eukprot:Gb_26678 [translate_table: standard]
MYNTIEGGHNISTHEDISMYHEKFLIFDSGICIVEVVIVPGLQGVSLIFLQIVGGYTQGVLLGGMSLYSSSTGGQGNSSHQSLRIEWDEVLPERCEKERCLRWKSISFQCISDYSDQIGFVSPYYALNYQP